MEKGRKFIQTKEVSWLDTPKNTIWVASGVHSYIQPEEEKYRDTPFGVELQLLWDTEDEFLFEEWDLPEGTVVNLPHNQVGYIEKVLDIPWGFRYVVRIEQATLGEEGELEEFKREQISRHYSINN